MGLIGKEFFKSLSARAYVIIAAITVITVLSCINFTYAISKEIEITDEEGLYIKYVTFKRTVYDALAQKGIKLSDGDKTNIDLNSRLQDNMVIEIYRKMPIIITANGEEKQLITTRRKVGDILNELGFNATENDIVNPALSERVNADSAISFIKSTQEIIRLETEIPFTKKEKANNSLAMGQKKVTQVGAPGKKESYYKISYHDGQEVSRELISENILAPSVDQLVEVGIKSSDLANVVALRGTLQTSRSGELRYSKVLTVTATAYDLSYASTGKRPGDRGYGITATGMKAQYGVVAVDPKVIPLHSKLYIEGANGSWVYGTAVAGDTGGAIKGNKIDLFFNTSAETKQFGRRQAKVYVLE